MTKRDGNSYDLKFPRIWQFWTLVAGQDGSWRGLDARGIIRWVSTRTCRVQRAISTGEVRTKLDSQMIASIASSALKPLNILKRKSTLKLEESAKTAESSWSLRPRGGGTGP